MSYSVVARAEKAMGVEADGATVLHSQLERACILTFIDWGFLSARPVSSTRNAAVNNLFSLLSPNLQVTS